MADRFVWYDVVRLGLIVSIINFNVIPGLASYSVERCYEPRGLRGKFHSSG